MNLELKFFKLKNKHFFCILELCSSIICHSGAKCKVDLTHKQPYCDCEEFKCDNSQPFPAVKQNRSQVVCGSDNKNYATLCDLKRSACFKQKRIDVQHYSACVNKNSDFKSNHPTSKSTSDKGKNFFIFFF